MPPSTTVAPAAALRPVRRHAALLAGLAVVSGSALTGCVPEPPPLAEVWPSVRASVDEATSVRVSGDVRQGEGTIDVELAGALDDSSYAGRLIEKKGTVEVIAADDTTFIRPDEKFVSAKGGETFKDVDPGLWISVPSGRDGAFSMSTFYEGFVSALPDADAFDGQEPQAETLRLDGERVFKYSDVDAGDGHVSLYINQDDELVRLEVDGESDSKDGPAGTIDFRDWNEVPPTEAPPEDQIYQRPGL
ncbi:hypothetical protein [Micrococcus sp. FDAARGOS_333]|uniref:hypothetical protein n=1 Tax=Micrococcus sp. FDAARGOS_333 TaxID=1930558 RepID=UPI000B4E0A78|nr:hypothetical protein [Micrococcus sp. FDAARGOS_333]PNL18233.1 hypothetical protein CEQ11_009215 [Micrococcus sp. FDAARGOS_333]